MISARPAKRPIPTVDEEVIACHDDMMLTQRRCGAELFKRLQELFALRKLSAAERKGKGKEREGKGRKGKGRKGKEREGKEREGKGGKGKGREGKGRKGKGEPNKQTKQASK